MQDIVSLALKERKIEVELKKYLKKTNDLYGEDFTCLVLNSLESPSMSLKSFTDKFPNISDTDIVLALIKAGTISLIDNYQNNYVRGFVSEGEMEKIMNIVYYNLSLRKMLTRTLIQNSYFSNSDIIKKKDSEDNTIGNLLTILFFQENIGEYNKIK